MEPRRDDGDDLFADCGMGKTPMAAMEPRRDDGDDPSGGMTPETTVAWPQWSPVVTTGTTRWLRAARRGTGRRNGAPS